MGRSQKIGLEYFPLDVTLDEKFRFIEIKFGLEGFAVIIKLLQKIYFNCYYMNLGEDEAVLVADEFRIDYRRFMEIIEEALKRGMFDKNLYEKYKILTSRGIQKVFLTATKKRVSNEIEPKFSLLKEVSEEEKDISAEEIPISDSESTQSKVKESKVKESKVKESRINTLEHEKELAGVEDSAKELAATQDISKPKGIAKSNKQKIDKGFEAFWGLYPRKRSKADALKAWEKIKPSQELLDTILETVKKAVALEWSKCEERFIPYPATWLRAEGWLNEYKATQKNMDQVPKSAERFNTTATHNFDFVELERLEQERIQRMLQNNNKQGVKNE